MKHSLPVLGLFLLLAGCGKVGDPLPPFIRIPESVKDLAVSQNGYNLILTWTNPARNIDASSASDLGRIQIRSGESLLTTVAVTGAGQAQSYVIPLGPSPAGLRAFAVRAETTQGKMSAISNAVSITPVEVPGPVVRLRAVVDQRHITLQWEKPEEHPELANAYIVIRIEPVGAPELVSGTRYEDDHYEPGKMFAYQVTAVRNTAGGTVPGVGPVSITALVEDKTAPQVPGGVDVVGSDTGAYLTWTANAETDLAGYRVFRSERADGEFRPIVERLTTTSVFFDPSARPGLFYAVSAVDDFGNESARSAPVRVP